MVTELEQLRQQIDQCMVKDRFGFTRKLQRIRSRDDQQFKALLTSIERSCHIARQRRDALPEINYPDALPISQKREEIAAAIEHHQVVVIAGETGSGKTTQIPKICLELGRGVYGMVGHTQPRRLAARSVATRVAEELKVQLGDQVGYQVRFTDQVSDKSQIKLMTDGILLAETQRDPYLNRYDTIIIDEAHERSLNIDFLLGYLKRLLPKRPDLKLIITSATIDLERFSKHFNNAPIIEVSGRTYPVEVIYQPPLESDDRRGDDLAASIIGAVETIRTFPRATGANDILIFLSGERDIREVTHELKKQQFRNTEILPLYARLSNAEQNRVFQPHRGDRIVLATNVAETSITVPGIRYVIDPGYARISRYSVRSKVQRLPIEPISQASANQRKGRCGRVADGVCIRLYEEDDFNNRAAFTDAEILRTNLGSVILQMLSLRLGDIQHFPFIDPPDNRSIRDGFELLKELGAVNDKGRITRIGRQIARFPVDPRIGRMLLAGAKEGGLTEVLIIASALTIQDPRERPLEKQQAADEKHRTYLNEDSDFIGYLNLWNTTEEKRQELSQNQFRKYCRQHFLSYLRVREWREIHRQLLLVCREMGFKMNQDAAEYGAIHRALLTGLLSHIGDKQEQKEYQGARNRRFNIFPGSGQFKKTPKWMMAAELVETAKLYARNVAKIDPAWIEPLAGHLIKKTHFEPHWEKKRAQVIAFEQVTLYGLVIVGRRRVDFGRVDPQQAREIFIRSALVEGAFQCRADFYRANLKLLEQVEELEHKSRRRDILVDDEVIFDFYNERLPEGICSGRLLENWVKTHSREEVDNLLLTREYLMQHGASQVTEAQFPDLFSWDTVRLKLGYCFEPGSDEDGVTLTVPIGLLNQIPTHRVEWLVPGMLRDKCIALVKGLPKPLRKHFVPVPGFVDRALLEMEVCDEPLTERLGHALKRLTGLDIPKDSWSTSRLDDYHRMNIQVIDEKGKKVGQGRDLILLRQEFSQQVKQSLQSLDRPEYERDNIIEWDFGDINREIEVRQAGMSLKAYSAISDSGDSVSLQLVDTPIKAKALSRQGILRLLILATGQQVKYLKKNLPGLKQISLYYSTIGSKERLLDDLIKAIYQRAFLSNSAIPDNQGEFDKLIAQHKGKLVEVANETADLIQELLQCYHRVAKTINGKVPLPWVFVYGDIKTQLERLVYDGFIAEVSWQRLQQYPRYLRAIEMRLDKIQNQLSREKGWCTEFEQLWNRYLQLKQQSEKLDTDTDQVEHLRWLIEEYRVSLYAQTLGTSEPVSAKRLEKYIDKIKL